jgi:hypothetical protein
MHAQPGRGLGTPEATSTIASASIQHAQNAITAGLNSDRCKKLDGDARTNCQIDKAMVNVGAQFAEQVKGRICTEVDPRLSANTGARRRRLLLAAEPLRRIGAALAQRGGPHGEPRAQRAPAWPDRPLPPQTRWSLEAFPSWTCTASWA